MNRIEFPIILYDHSGFASGIDDGAPSRAWPASIKASDYHAEIVNMAGPPLYGVPVQITRVPWPWNDPTLVIGTNEEFKWCANYVRDRYGV